MLSDWIRGFRDPELLYKKLLVFADSVEGAAKAAYEASCSKVKTLSRLVYWGFVISASVTVVSLALWFALHGLGVRATGFFQFLVVAVGLTWACFLTFLAVLLAVVEGIIRQFQRLEKLLNDFKESLLHWIRIPTWIAFVTLFLAVLMARFPGLQKPESFLSLVLIIAAFGLAAFLSVCSVNLVWLRRFVYIQFFIALFLILIPSLFPHEAAWLSRKIGALTGPIRENAGPMRVTVNPDSPPPFFDAITGEPLFWYSQRPDGEFALWDAKGRDPDTNEELLPVRTKEVREKILSWLRSEALRNPKPIKAEPITAPKRVMIRSADDVVFVNQLGSNIVWFYGSPAAGYELYDAPGFHRTGARLLPADTDEIREVILNWFTTRQQPGALTPHEPIVPNGGDPTRILAPEPKHEARGAFSSEARPVIAGDLLQRDTTKFDSNSFGIQIPEQLNIPKGFDGWRWTTNLYAGQKLGYQISKGWSLRATSNFKAGELITEILGHDGNWHTIIPGSTNTVGGTQYRFTVVPNATETVEIKFWLRPK